MEEITWSHAGQRTLQRRKNRGLSREEVAGRAGMEPGYLEYLDDMPVVLTLESLIRLAGALDTTVDALLGSREAADVEPWAGGPRDIYVRVDPERVTGRRIRTPTARERRIR